MKLAFSTNAYLRFPFDEAARRIAALGYDGLELMADVPHAWPAGLLDGPKREIRAALERNRLEFSNVNAFMMNAINDYRQPYWYPSFIEPDPGYRRVRIDHTHRALSLCAELGAPHITTEPGGPLAPDQSRQEAIDLFVEVLKLLAEHAHTLGIPLLIEPEPGLLLETSDQYLEVAERVDAPSIGLNFDVGHAFCVAEDLPRAIAKLAPHIRHYHLEDIAASRVHHHLAPGTGAIDFAEVIAAIRGTGYDGWLTVELYPFVDDPDAAARRAQEVLRPLMSQGVAARADTMELKPYLQLVRLPNLFTAAADSLAGWLLVRGTFEVPARWVPLVAASMAIYAAGIALNDVFDLEIDRRERPSRPLPSGRVSTRFATWLGGGLLVLGPVLAALSGSAMSLAVASALAACVLAYDAGLKRTPLGPEVMGTCRGLNLLLGMSQSEHLGGPPGWLVAGALALFVVGVTWISRSETESGRRGGIMAGTVLQDVAFLGLMNAALSSRAFPAISPEWTPQWPLAGLLMLLGVGWIVNRADVSAIRQPLPATVQRAVKTGVLSLVWLNVSMVVAVRGPLPALPVAALWVPAFVLARWLYAT